MKKLLTVCCLIGMTMLFSSCSQDSEFKKVINKKLKTQYSCLDLHDNYHFSGPRGFNHKKFQAYKEKHLVMIIYTKQNDLVEKLSNKDMKNVMQLDALVKENLLKKTQIIQPGLDYSDRPIKGLSFIVDFYNLTKKGREAVHRKSSFFGNNQPSLCYAYPQAENIINFFEERFHGQDIVEVKYSYNYILEKWADNKNILTAFPAINQLMKEKKRTAKMALIKTSNGWQTDL